MDTFSLAEKLLEKGAESEGLGDVATEPLNPLIHQATGGNGDITLGSVSANEGLRLMNARVTEMIGRRRAELEEGVMDSPIRQKLVGIKAVNDQFNFISKISEDLLRAAAKMA
jgi:hypothetical protein